METATRYAAVRKGGFQAVEDGSFKVAHCRLRLKIPDQGFEILQYLVVQSLKKLIQR